MKTAPTGEGKAAQVKTVLTGERNDARVKTAPTGEGKEPRVKTAPTRERNDARLQTAPTVKTARVKTAPTGEHKEPRVKTAPTWWNEMTAYWLFYVTLTLCLARAILRTTRGLHILQLDGYKTTRYVRWIAQHLSHCFEIKEVLIVAALVLLTVVYPAAWLFPVLCIAWGAFQAAQIIWRKKVEAKKPLVYTARAKRVFGFAVFLLVGLAIVLAQVARLQSAPTAWHVAVFLFSEVTVITLTVANLLIYPLERTINGAYLRAARKRIQTLRPKVIGITGSYGKTSTKYILHQILSQKFNALMTPDSYNTPMGVTKVIRGELTAAHEVFIVEMGAYRRGDIRELCQLASPEIGILTAVGMQHLERFKSIKTIAKTKYELIESLPANGLAVFNCDNDIVAGLADKTDDKQVIRYAVDADNAALTASNVRHTEAGLEFTVHCHAEECGGQAPALRRGKMNNGQAPALRRGKMNNGQAPALRHGKMNNGQAPPLQVDGEIEMRTRLLGRHNVSNILAATSVALACGMELAEIRDAVAKVEPVPHRLQLSAGAGGVTIIDDSFNANPVGAKAALEVLDDFGRAPNGGKKVLVTPGMVELGEQEYEENRRFGERAAQVCDRVILVGRNRTAPILEGLKTANYPKDRVSIAANLAEVKDYLAKLLKPGDVVLFENDLPDNYNESSVSP